MEITITKTGFLKMQNSKRCFDILFFLNPRLKLTCISLFQILLIVSFVAYTQENSSDSSFQFANNKYWNGSNITACALSTASTGLFFIAGYSYSKCRKQVEAYKNDSSRFFIPIGAGIFGTVFLISGITGGACSFASIPLWVKGNKRNHQLKISPDISLKLNGKVNTELYFGLRIFVNRPHPAAANLFVDKYKSRTPHL